MSEASGSTTDSATRGEGRPSSLSPAQAVVFSFLCIIALGAALLSLPGATRGHAPLPAGDALFLSTSAVCVTGLAVRDIGTVLSGWGQAVMCVLIQVGGLGYMACATGAVLFLGGRVGLRQRAALSATMGDVGFSRVTDLVRGILALTAAIELVAATIFFVRFLPLYPPLQALGVACFHSVSAFCNAGFDLFGGRFEPYCSLTPFAGDAVVCLATAAEIVLGGLGFLVLLDCMRRPRQQRLLFASRLVLVTTSALILAGVVGFGLLEWSRAATLGRLAVGERILAALFQSITCRTAGFSVVPCDHLQNASLYLGMILMFIGASPGGTGGGIKTTTAMVLWGAVLSAVLGRDEVVLFRRTVPQRTLYSALAVMTLSAAVVIAASLLLSVIEGAGVGRGGAGPHRQFLDLAFEATSAFGTVGLSTGITPRLSPLSRIVLIVTMVAGRVGPLTLALALAQRKHRQQAHYPEENVTVG